MKRRKEDLLVKEGALQNRYRLLEEDVAHGQQTKDGALGDKADI